MKPLPLVSVVMPVYNHENYVTQALYSILDQTYPNIEVIIIDDGSKDTSCAKIESDLSEWKTPENKQRKINFIKQNNRGAHVTINYGLSLAQGEWLTILNSDDYYHVDRIQTLLDQTLSAKTEIAFSYVVGIDEENKILPSNHWWWRWYEGSRCKLFTFNPTIGFLLLQDNFTVSTGNLFFSRKLFNEVGPFKNLKLAHDLDFILRALPLYEPLLVRENHYFYRLHGSNTQYEVSHLREKEFDEIYREYLCKVYPQPPKNKQAPCHWYWPSEFAKWRTKLKMDRSLEVYIKRGEKKASTINTFNSPVPIKAKDGIPITLISHELSLSGAPKVVADLAICLSHQGYSPRVISIFGGPMKQELEKHGIPVNALVNKSKIIGFVSLLYALCFRIKGKVIANSIMSWPMVLPLSLFRPWNKPIWYIHESFTPLGVIKGIRRKIVSPLLKLTKKFSPPRLWFGSDATRKAWTYSEFPPGQVMYWSGIPKQLNQPKKKSQLRHLLSVGTASSRKGTHTLVSAFLLCIQENRIPKDSTLTIVGFPNSQSPDFIPLCDTILKVVTSNYRDQIHLIGSVENDQLDKFFQEADVYIQSSVSECLPIALLTAMSLGLPIVTTNVDGCTEAVVDHQTGYICLPYDVHSLADAMTEAVNNSQQSIEMGKKAMETFNAHFSLEATQGHILNELK